MKYTLMAERELLREQGRAPRVTNLIPSSNQSIHMCGNAGRKRKQLYGHSCRMIVQDLLDKIKDMNERVRTFTII
jgi:hypothetical protein